MNQLTQELLCDRAQLMNALAAKRSLFPASFEDVCGLIPVLWGSYDAPSAVLPDVLAYFQAYINVDAPLAHKQRCNRANHCETHRVFGTTEGYQAFG